MSWLLSVVLATALAEEPPPVEVVTVPAWEEPYRFVATAEPLGPADDRSASGVERAIVEAEPALTACRLDALKRGEGPLRYLMLELKLKPSDGGVRKATVGSSTGVEAVDACVTAAVLAHVRLDPPPQYADKVEVHLTWAVPPKEEPAP